MADAAYPAPSGGPETSDARPGTEPASAGLDLRPVVLSRAAVQMRRMALGARRRGPATGADPGRVPQSIGAPSGAKKRLCTWWARELTADSSERCVEELGRVREDLWPEALGRAAVQARGGGTRQQERAWGGIPKAAVPHRGQRKDCEGGGRMVRGAGLQWRALRCCSGGQPRVSRSLYSRPVFALEHCLGPLGAGIGASGPGSWQKKTGAEAAGGWAARAAARAVLVWTRRQAGLA
ncbi:hypothetical protein NDU88_000993 [Pleurodeles waltl]|uniref:Uncharacterized protein n=1 Tax=Pleurodeles waltl TaxID=8319 RepID=A0AAV7U604_PLEWA|nr:hypothetical protein NDU88_000993 [Pleurodeles waltl]